MAHPELLRHTPRFNRLSNMATMSNAVRTLSRARMTTEANSAEPVVVLPRTNVGTNRRPDYETGVSMRRALVDQCQTHVRCGPFPGFFEKKQLIPAVQADGLLRPICQINPAHSAQVRLNPLRHISEPKRRAPAAAKKRLASN